MMFNIIQNKIINFNLKVKMLIDIISKKYSNIQLNIEELPENEHNLEKLIDIVKNICSRLKVLKEEINNRNLLNTKLMQSRYEIQYNNKDDLYWGIGLENECYLQGNLKKILGKNITKMLGKERYSVDYTSNYNIEDIKNTMSQIYLNDKYYNVSQMLNSHSLDKIDRNGQHRTTYEKEPKQNPKFTGKSVMEEWFEYDPEIKEIINSKINTETNVFFDGDTIEFITEKFYKTNTENITNELKNTKKKFIDKFNDFKEKTHLWSELGKINYVLTHPGLNIFNSMPNKIVFFNNTTIHIHLTLPTKIKKSLIVDKSNFNKVHNKAIKLLQWFEPFFICTLGSPDIMQYIYEKNNPNNNYFSKGSMRATISRYIGVGTYNMEEMGGGKNITKKVDSLRPNGVKWWRDMIKEKLQYNLPENDMGLDFNFAKHYQSGLEFRLLDGIPLENLKDVIDIIILICEHSYSYDNTIDILTCSVSQTWNNIIYKSMIDGYNANITKCEITDFLRMLKIDMFIDKEEILLEDFYYKVLEYLFELYKNKETFAIKYMTKDFNKIKRWENFNKIQESEHKKSLEPL
jgi:hypothetical protein